MIRTDDESAVLMNRVAGGDSTAYARLVERYGDSIRRVCFLLLHCPHAAEDATQETFAQALARISQYRGEGEPRSWFYSIALNVSRRWLRGEEKRAALSRRKDDPQGRWMGFSPRGLLTSLVRRETVQQLAIAMGYLTEGQRESFILFYVEDLPYEEIAQILGLSSGAARALSHRARAILQTKVPNLAL